MGYRIKNVCLVSTIRLTPNTDLTTMPLTNFSGTKNFVPNLKITASQGRAKRIDENNEQSLLAVKHVKQRVLSLSMALCYLNPHSSLLHWAF